MKLNKKLLILIFMTTVFCFVSNLCAQEKTDEVVRVETRVVFVDTLVRDKKTGAPVRDLNVESFKLFDDGKPREISYFSREGLTRRPLALILVLDLCTSGILYLEKPEVMEHIISALGKLQPEDEVAVFQTWYQPNGAPLNFQIRSKMVEGFTRDRTKTFAALRNTQEFAKQNLEHVKLFFSMKETMKATWKDAIFSSIKTAGGMLPIDPPIRITVAPDYEYMIDKAPVLATEERPDSQVMIVQVTDDFGADYYGKTTKTAQKLIASNVTVNGLVMKKDLMGKAVNALGTVISPLIGTRFHTISYYGKQTGGEVAEVGNAEQFASSIDNIIGGIAARYSLGFVLEDGEKLDGRMHKLEIKIKAQDKSRNLTVNARHGYYPGKVLSRDTK
jgi:VWFA-related protein